MRDYIDILGSAGIIALLCFSAYDVFSSDNTAVVQPIVYKDTKPCKPDPWNIGAQSCNKIPSYDLSPDQKKQVIDISFSTN